MNRSSWVLGAVVVGSLASGCGVASSESTIHVAESSDTWEEQDWGVSNELDVVHTVLRGDLGEVGGIEHEATTIRSLDFVGYSEVDLTTQAPGGAAMLMVDIQGGLAHADLAPGSVRTYGLDAPREDTDVTVMGCSGPEVDDWEFDEYADEVTVRISALPSGNRRMDLTATWRHQLSGRPLYRMESAFEYAPPASR